MAIREQGESCSIRPSTADILRRRADELAQPTGSVQVDMQDEWGDVLVVRVGKDKLCLPTRFVNEVTLLGQVLPLPGLPDVYSGVTSLRSRIYAVLDTARLFGIGRNAEEADQKSVAHGVIVQGPNPEIPETEFVLAVDAVFQVVGIKASDVGEVPEGITKQLERYAYAMVKAGKEYGLVLDMEKLLSDEDLRVDGAW